MASRPLINTSQKNRPPGTNFGVTLSQEFQAQAYQEGERKRRAFILHPGPFDQNTIGNTSAELLINGIPNFRFRLAQDSVAHLTIRCLVISTVTSETCTITLEQGVRNYGGTVTLHANSTVAKCPAVAPATLTLTPTGSDQLLFQFATNTATPALCVALVQMVEITDIG